MIEGNVLSVKNLRSSPNDTSSTNLIGTIGGGSTFLGNETSQDSKGRGIWIKLLSINGVPVSTETWVAGWVVSYKTIPDPIPQEPIGVPVRLKLIEFFENGATRESSWENPVVVE